MSIMAPFPSTHFMRDILRQPELQLAVAYLTGDGQTSLQYAATMVQRARHVFLTAAVGAGTLFGLHGHPAYMQEAGELLHFTAIPTGCGRHRHLSHGQEY